MHHPINDYPKSVTIGGIEYPIRSDFRDALLILGAGDDLDLSREECLSVQLGIFYKDFEKISRRQDLPEFVDVMVDFLRCGQQSDSNSTETKTLDYRQDWAMIVAAFQKDYGINLSESKLHWWHFCALMNGLSEDNTIVKIVGYRAVNLTDIKDKEMRKFYGKMKQKHSLKNSPELTAMQDEADLEFIKEAEQKRKMR